MRDPLTPRNTKHYRKIPDHERRRYQPREYVTGSYYGDRNAMLGRAVEFAGKTEARKFACDYRGKNTADGRCPGCGERAHRQRSRRRA